MSYYAGSDGYLEFEGQRVGRVARWSLDASMDLRDDSRVGDCEKRFKPGSCTYTGSASVWYYSDSPAAVLGVLFKTGTADPPPVEFVLGWGAGSKQRKRIKCDGFITNASLACEVGQVMQAQVSFTVDGQLQEVIL
jgi:hypothetical protein